MPARNRAAPRFMIKPSNLIFLKQSYRLDSICPSAGLTIVQKIMNTYNAQLEMSFTAAARLVNRRQRRISRAQWWFQRMRQIVDRTIAWQPAPTPPPEQIWFPVAEREPGFRSGSSDTLKIR
jgi:hypothetical protein